MRLTALCFAALTANGAAQTLPGIMAGPLTNQANGHIYFLLQPAAWSNSEMAAVELGGHLVTINDSSEDAWVFSSFVPFRNGAAGYWIGLTDSASEGTFAWVSGDTSTYRNWGSGEPNNLGNEDYGCYFTIGALAGKWNDCGDWHDPMPGIVEIDRPVLRVEVASIQLSWNSTTNRRYQIQYALEPVSNNWNNWGAPINGEDARTHLIIGTLNQPRAMYRVIEFAP